MSAGRDAMEPRPGLGSADDPEFRLEESAGGTLLSVTESGFDSIPAVRRDEAFRMNDGGWEGQMNNIKTHVERAA